MEYRGQFGGRRNMCVFVQKWTDTEKHPSKDEHTWFNTLR